MKRIIVFNILVVLVFNSCINSVNDSANSKANLQDSILKRIFHKAEDQERLFKHDKAYFYYYNYLLNAKKWDDSIRIARGFFKLSKLDFYKNDYQSSQKNAIEALHYLKGKEKENLFAVTLNILGLSLKELGDYQEAIVYFNKYRASYFDNKDTLKQFVAYQNNMGNVYQESGNYKKSIGYYMNIIKEESVKIQYPKRYARAIDNKAWSLFKDNNKEEVLGLLEKSLNIRKKENDQAGIVVSLLHLSSYYISIKQQYTAKEKAASALKLAQQIKIPYDELESLLLLAKSDNNNAVYYFTQYQQLRDSLLNKERNFKDQTAKIRYETHQKEQKIIKQNQLLKKRKKELFWGTFFGFLLVLASSLFWFQKKRIYNQNTKLEIQNTTINELQRELHHRVKNNLGLISSLIEEMQQDVDNPKINAKLTDLLNRIDSMYNIHQQLYKNRDDISQIHLKDYVNKLIVNIQKSYRNENIKVEENIKKSLFLPVKMVFPVALLINEFVTNSYKHAFTLGQQGVITIRIEETSKEYQIHLKDNGKGLPDTFNIKSLNSFGMDVMQLLSKQLKGTFLLTNKKGVSLTVKFPKT